MNYNQVIVVEGNHDEQKIKSVYPNIECIVTNGSEISTETLNLIYESSFKKEVVLFLDPDYPGKKITTKILETKGNFKIAYINKEKAQNKNHTKVGVEHAKEKDIRESIDNMLTISHNIFKLSKMDLLKRGLVNQQNSAILRKKVCEKLNIPFANGKTFLKYLNMLDIKIERIDDIIYELKSQSVS